jgi:hypothetical protein
MTSTVPGSLPALGICLEEYHYPYPVSAPRPGRLPGPASGRNPTKPLYQHELHWTDPATIRGYVTGYFVKPDPKVWEPLDKLLPFLATREERQHCRAIARYYLR